jgi:ubiquinone/menaquinone biosynthesis C-methylase UbiE
MKMNVDYDQVAPTYNRRYTASPMLGTEAALLALAHKVGARRGLEAGCGTGHWLEALQSLIPEVYGLDLSPGMLQQAQMRGSHLRLTRGRATRLPFLSQAFDLVICVNALHHFGEPPVFISEARRLLRAGGALAVVGANPHEESRDSWYIYRYFEGTYEMDLERFPSPENITRWMSQSGFNRLERFVVENIDKTWMGREVFTDPFMKKESTSQLTLLTDEEYAAGLRRIETAVAEAEAGGRDIEFPSVFSLVMWIGRI